MNFRLFSACLLSLLLVSATACAAAPKTAMVEMRDGIKLETDIYLPDGDGPFATVLMRSVYGRKSGPDIAKGLNNRRLALVVQDCRGRGGSEGKDMVFADDGWGERQDGADTVAWIVKQAWSNGKVGTSGGSALGIVQVMMAPATNEVDTQSIVVACSNFYGQISYQGGVWRKELCEGWTKAQKTDTYIVPEWKSHPTYDAFWEMYNAEEKAGDVTAPAMHVGGWFDIFNQGTINNFVTRQHEGGEGARGNQKLIMGPWVHGVKRKVGDIELRDNFNFDFGKYERYFFAAWLMDKDDGARAAPAVNYYTVGDVDDPDAPGNEWHTADDWPPFPTLATSYYLRDGGRLTTEPATADSAPLAYAYDPANPCPTHGGQNLLLPAGPFDQREVSGRADVLKFATDPLEQPLEITGQVFVKLFVSTDAPDTDFTAKLVDIYPDGREILMLDNIRRLKFRNGYETADPLPAGEIGELAIDLWSISLIFNKSHRIGVQVSSSNHPRFEINPNSGDDWPTDTNKRVANNKVYVDAAHPSALILPVRPH
ncbi:MAG TPA: CocE/NonD family hydrolase [Candidatus Bathyarchaeia archaeon]|nr:CocE/NonD family hydrolase [Candidatus Bathyarchaeia archaeon]